jgi:DNA-binding MarR family transcriptional regulator
MTIDPNSEDWELLSQISQDYRTLSDNFMDRIGMHRAQATLLGRLYVNNGMTQSELADQLVVQGATITNILQHMEKAVFVTRRQDDEDNPLGRVDAKLCYRSNSGQH